MVDLLFHFIVFEQVEYCRGGEVSFEYGEGLTTVLAIQKIRSHPRPVGGVHPHWLLA